MRSRRLSCSLLFFLFELVKPPIGMTSYLVRSRLRKRFGLVAGASGDQGEGAQACGHSDPRLLQTSPWMTHFHLLLSVLLVERAMQIVDRLYNATV